MRMSGKVHYYKKFIKVDIDEPIFEATDYSRVRINEKYVKEARSSGRYLVVGTQKGELIYLPKALSKIGKKVKEVFLYADNPMKMYELDIPHSMKKDEEYWQWA